MANSRIEEKNYFPNSFVLSRILNSGIIMSIEKNEKELKGLEKSIKKITKSKYVVLCNSFTGAIHCALWGQNKVYGSSINLNEATEQEKKFINWLGINLNINEGEDIVYEKVSINSQNIDKIDEMVSSKKDKAKVMVLDFTDVGFGPCAVIATDDELIWKKAERLIIFGAFDLRTMWTQEDDEKDLQPAAQFNYRLSPLVAGCVKLSLLRRKNK
ncbi:MAG: degT/DnrJ/EryC1/StrS aminotransferase [Clostridium sp.]|nr:degT/DnrJ/EryC1/StrS aminotransferase [Clostridium sp.]